MEELRILDKKLDIVAFIDDLESFIWTDRFDDYGDFEIVLPANATTTDYIKLDYFIQNPQSESIMIIESITFHYSDQINKVTIKGRSAECLLERRIIWGNKSFTNTSIKNILETLLNENVINPSDHNRKIDILTYRPIVDPAILPTIVDAQYDGENLMSAIRDLCASKDIGIKARKNGNKVELEFYKGVNRSLEQTKNSPVMFSNFFDNLINTTYFESLQDFKNVALVGGEEKGTDKTYSTFGEGSGLDRREIYVNGSGISRTQEVEEMPIDIYKAQLAQKGREELAQHRNQISADSEVGTLSTTFIYGYDYQIGDVVQVTDPFQHNFCARVSENIYSRNTVENKTYPTFSYIEGFGYETITYEGETYVHIAHHNNKGGTSLFDKSIDFTDEVKMDNDRWSKMHLIPYLNVGSEYKFLVRQNSVSVGWEDYVFAQSKSPWNATFEDTTHNIIRPIKNIPSSYGGIYFSFNSHAYEDCKSAFYFNNGTKGNWWSICSFMKYEDGAPGYSKVSAGAIDLYLRVLD